MKLCVILRVLRGKIIPYLHDFISLFFPDLCAGCGTNLFNNEQSICTNCIYHLPVTNFHNDPQNRLAKQLWGRFSFVQASSFVYFNKGGRVQNIMHQLKYNKKPEAGFRMGQLYAHALRTSESWQIPDFIIPVPLHPGKLKKRGYNQSEYIANGIASTLAVPMKSNNLIRIENTDTQTKKSRFARYENLSGAFMCLDENALRNKHILVVDDVMTTGATLEACCIVLLELNNVRISVATIAFAE
ncbi:ComF family protein [Daejeonella lutea]|uniref:ComF family protein n=1 Tax=Daejeonella lutea TaxID=572036 RepID=A0A1T5E6V2_9SPHI|nr:ComF family protein [Daejeonella lutea]SKB79599.1 comF family protein [Daejeonella lutea]